MPASFYRTTRCSIPGDIFIMAAVKISDSPEYRPASCRRVDSYRHHKTVCSEVDFVGSPPPPAPEMSETSCRFVGSKVSDKRAPLILIYTAAQLRTTLYGCNTTLINSVVYVIFVLLFTALQCRARYCCWYSRLSYVSCAQLCPGTEDIRCLLTHSNVSVCCLQWPSFLNILRGA
jgi:hypothetical protein